MILSIPHHHHIGKDGRVFHASRQSHGFTTDPANFTTEKDNDIESSSWFDLPPPTGTAPYRLSLDSILTANAIKKITDNKSLVFHAVGDTGGVNTTTYQQHVETFMELDFLDKAPSFFYHLGDVVYYNGEVVNYYWEFYEPYLHYPAPIFAIPGNHDGNVNSLDEFHDPLDSLKGFVRNFCAPIPTHMPEADDVPRTAMTQPNVYWTLLTPLATFIGLYTNVPEGGRIDAVQLDWFKNELKEAPDLPIVLSLHHPVFSAYGHHPGSQHLKSVIESATGRIPDLILTGHVHNYQRFTWKLQNKNVPVIVAGAGGYNRKLHVLERSQFDPTKCPYEFDNNEGILEAFNDWQHGYLLIEVTDKNIIGKYIAVNDPQPGDMPPTKQIQPYDTFEVTL